MKDENVNRGSVHVSDNALYVSPCFLFYFSAFFISLRTFYEKKVLLFLCISLKTFWWDFVIMSLQLFSSSWSDVEPGFKP